MGLALALSGASAQLGCVAQGEPLGLRLSERESDAGPAPVTFGEDLEPPPANTLPSSDPHAVRSVDPSHGPFPGGAPVIIRGAGFTSDARVWFGETLVPSADIVPVDPRRLQVIVPAGSPGTTSVVVQSGSDESTRRTLPLGYTYDPFYLEPATSPVGGGVVVTVHGEGTAWTNETTVLVDLNPCEVTALRSAGDGRQELDCVLPEGTPGSKPVRVTTGSESTDVLDAFLYADSADGFRGGLGGAALSGRLRVIALDDATGQTLAGAAVIVGDAAGASTVVRTGATGVAEVAWEAPTATVTVAATCHHPMTFVDVPVDTVTVYLGPVLSPECAPEGDPPASGGAAGTSSSVTGEIVFPGFVEFKRPPWRNVPSPGSAEGARVAYVFPLSRNATTAFRLPASSAATTPDSEGGVGYEFELKGVLGNLTLYALAGIENRDLDPPLFTAYAMGLVTGVRVDPDATTEEIYIPVDNPLDRALTIEVDGPTPNTRGPDHVAVSVALRVGRLGYAILPGASVTGLLPTPAPFEIVGMPPLVDSLADGRLVVTATADTGLSRSPPRSVIGLYAPERAATLVHLDGFVEVPVLEVPAPGSLWDGTALSVGAAPGGSPADVLVVEVHGPADTFRWVITAPGDRTHIALPDPDAVPELSMPSGPLTVEINRARIDGFDYAKLGYRQLGTSGWDAYATDTVTAVHP